MEHPKLRYLEAFPYSQGRQTLVALRDPAHISEQVMVVTPQLYSVLLLLDGRHSLLDIQAELTRRNGELVFREDLEKILKQLDDAHFLDNERFRNRYQEVLEQFRSQAVRPSFHASLSYPADPTELTETLSSFYLHPQGAGLPQGHSNRELKALIAPHIDLRLGGATYTHAYRALGESSAADLFVILGTGHLGLPEYFSISPKDFVTPLGRVETDREFLRLFQEALSQSLYGEDLTHRHEHTIEFQLLFLQHLFRGRSFQILPVLCSFGYADVEGDAPQGQLFWRWIEAFRSAWRKSGKRICLVASVDLAHIGPRYGDRFRPGEGVVEEVFRKDRQMLEAVCAGRPQDFKDFVQEERDQRRICGFAPLYTLLTLLEGETAQLLAHRHAVMDPTGSFVTYASLVVEG